MHDRQTRPAPRSGAPSALRRASTLGLLAAALAGVACRQDSLAPGELSLSTAFDASQAGFDEVTSSFAAGGAAAWAPERGAIGMFGGGDNGGPGGGRRGPGDIGAGFMGGGFDPALFGDLSGRGRGHERGPFASAIDSTCAFSASTGDVTCGPTTRQGLTITRVYSFKTTAGVAQAKPDSTTNSERVRATVSGTRTGGRGNFTSTVQSSSDRTVTGLAYNATQRTVNSRAQGTESSSGTNRDGVAFTSTRATADTIIGVVIPRAANDSTRAYPTAGSVRRHMRATLTSNGATTTSARDEIITYDGSATAKVVLTQDGTTKSCTLPLPRGRLTCS